MGKITPTEADDADEAGEPDSGADTAELRVIAVVGHRPPELGGYDANPISDGVRRRLSEIIDAKQKMFGPVRVLTGLGLGAETLAAEAALEVGAEYVAVLAFPDPAAKWPKASRDRFDDLLDEAADVVIVSKKVPKTATEAGKAFGARDRRLQAEADEAIVVYDGKHSGVGASARAFEKALAEDVWIIDPGEFA